MDIHETLKERGSKHGKFEDHAAITQAIKDVMHESPNWDKLPDTMKEALDMDAHKTGRILAGDFNHHDHWHDKVGYITLVADTLLPKEQTTK
jgi:hypothetical protein